MKTTTYYEVTDKGKTIEFKTSEFYSKKIMNKALENTHVIRNIERDFHHHPVVITRVIFKDEFVCFKWLHTTWLLDSLHTACNSEFNGRALEEALESLRAMKTSLNKSFPS